MTTTLKASKQTVLRYVLTNLGENLVMMHPAAVFVMVQPHKKGVELFALMATENANGDFPEGDLEPRRFYVAKTGETVTEPAAYLGTATLPTMKARHVFQLI